MTDPGESSPRGARPALEAEWNRRRRGLVAVLLAHGARRSEIDDLLQEVALTWMRRGASLRRADNLAAWLRTVAANTARRARRRDGLVEACDWGEEPSDPRAASDERRREDRDELARVLAWASELPLELREPLLMRTVGGLPTREVATALGVSTAAVERRVARARDALRRRRDEQRPRAPEIDRQDGRRRGSDGIRRGGTPWTK